MIGTTIQSKNFTTQTLTIPVEIIKRDGSLAIFNRRRIISAIERAGEATDEFSSEEALQLSKQVLEIVCHRFGVYHPTVEQVQDIVIDTLFSAKYLKTAHAYIAYREKHQQLRNEKENG